MSISEIPAAAVADDATVLDVREDDEWQAGHVDGATHIPVGDVPARIAELPKGATLSVVCRAGGRSAHVTQLLAQQGYDAVNIAGGMQAWAAAGRLMVSEGGAPPEVI